MILNKSAFALVSLMLWSSTILAQQTIHVPAEAPTIQAGINAAGNGDSVLVAPGTYNENIDFQGKAITVTSGAKSFTDAAVLTTVINGTSDGPVVAFRSNEPTTALLNGFTVQNGHANVSSGLNGGGISISGSSPTITNNLVTNNSGCGIFVFDGSSPLIQGNDIKQNSGAGGSLCLTPAHIGANAGTGLAIVSGGDVQVIGNTIEDNNISTTTNANCCAGVVIYSGAQILLKNNIIRNNIASFYPAIGESLGAPATNLLLIQNLIYGNRNPDASVSTSLQFYLSGTFQAPYPSVTEINNTIYGGGQELILSFAPSTIANNMFVNSSTGQFGLLCADAGAQSSSLGLNNNNIFNLGQPLPSNCPFGSGGLSVDPLFLNSSANDFHTQPTSPVVTAGTISAPDIQRADLDGKSRIVDGMIGMGVYEIHPRPPISLQVSPNPTTGESTVTFTATLGLISPGPTGQITFLDGKNVLGSGMIGNNGVATLSTASLTVGTHTLMATYAGDFNFDSSTSNAVQEIITGYPTTLSLSASPIMSPLSQPVTLTLLVTSAGGTPTGTATFMAGNTNLGTAPLDTNGRAALTIDTLALGTYSITAVYSGDTHFANGISNPVSVIITDAKTSIGLAGSPNPAAFGQTVTLAAMISVLSSAKPMGTVTFKDGSATLGSAAVGANGVANLSTSTLSIGTHSLSAAYGGSTGYDGSVSNTVNEVITAIPTVLSLNASPTPANLGATVTLTATAASLIGGSMPDGIVVFSDQAGVLGATHLNGGIAKFATQALSLGTHEITATLNTSGTFIPSTSPTVSEVITNYDFAIAVSSTSLKIPSGDYQVLTVTLTPLGGFTGAVVLGCSSLPDHTLCNFAPSTTKPLSSGAQTVQLTINTSDVLGYGERVGALGLPTSPLSKDRSRLLAGLLFPLVTLCGLLGGRARRFDPRLRRVFLIIAIAGLSCSFEACSGKLPGKTSAGNYSIAINGNGIDSGSTTVHTTNLQLVVTP